MRIYLCLISFLELEMKHAFPLASWNLFTLSQKQFGAIDEGVQKSPWESKRNINGTIFFLFLLFIYFTIFINCYLFIYNMHVGY